MSSATTDGIPVSAPSTGASSSSAVGSVASATGAASSSASLSLPSVSGVSGVVSSSSSAAALSGVQAVAADATTANTAAATTTSTDSSAATAAAAAAGMKTMQCLYCYITLQFPMTATYIMCPHCRSTINPSKPDTAYVSCLRCRTLLEHSPTESVIQCPECNLVLELPEHGSGYVGHSSQHANNNAATAGASSHVAHPHFVEERSPADYMREGQMGLVAAAAGSTPFVSQAYVKKHKSPQGEKKPERRGRKPKHGNSSSKRKSSSSGATQGATKKKKKRDPNMPKRASNAYMIFCKQRRAELKALNPNLPFGKIGAKLGDIWRGMPAEEKVPYEKQAIVDRERYRKEMEAYKATLPPEEDSDSGAST